MPLSRLLFRMLLLAYPKRTRQENGVDMWLTFERHLRDARRVGRVAVFGVWRREVVALWRGAWRARVFVREQRRANARRVGSEPARNFMAFRMSLLDFKLGFRMLVKYPVLTLIGVFAGVVPAIRVTGGSVHKGLGQNAGESGLRFGRLSTAVIVTQVAFSVAFLTIAFGMGQDAIRYRTDDLDLPANEYLTVRLLMDRETPSSVLVDRLQADFSERYSNVYDEIARRVVAEPGVSGVTFADRLPGMPHTRGFVEVDGVALPGDSAAGHAVSRASVDVGFFDALGTPILSGRGFNSGDVRSDRGVAIVNQSFVSQQLGNQNPIGRRVRHALEQGEQPGQWLEIVGVVNDLGMNSNNPAQAAGLYRPVAPANVYPIRMTVRVRQDPRAFAQRLRAIAVAVEPTLRLDGFMTLDEVGRAEQRARRFGVLVITLIAAMILLLSTAGIYALMSFTVSRRTREIGIRTALGAHPQRILSAIFSRALLQLGLGVVVGVVGIALLPGVEDTIGERLETLMGVSALMMVAGLLACVVPARRALGVEPTDALRAG